jgi:hypothetical protein
MTPPKVQHPLVTEAEDNKMVEMLDKEFRSLGLKMISYLR